MDEQELKQLSNKLVEAEFILGVFSTGYWKSIIEKYGDGTELELLEKYWKGDN